MTDFNTSHTYGNGASNITYTFPAYQPDTDLRVRVLGLAVQRGEFPDPVALAERMLAFVEGRSVAPEMPEDAPEIPESFAWDVRSMLGKRVRVLLDITEDGDVISEGILLGFGDGGDFEIQEDDGFVHYCWPMLEIELVEDEA